MGEEKLDLEDDIIFYGVNALSLIVLGVTVKVF